MEPKVSWQAFTGSRNDGSDKVRLLIVITEVIGLPSPAIFDSKNKIFGLTRGRGFFFASEDCADAHQADEKIALFDSEVDEYLTDFIADKTTLKKVARTSQPAPSPTE